MNEAGLKNLWQQSVNKDITEDQNVYINAANAARSEVFRFISTMKPVKIFTVFAGMLWVAFWSYVLGNIYLYGFSEANKFFLFSLSFQVILTAIALVIYIYQLVTIYKADLSMPILKAQEIIAALKSSTLIIARILFLQLPLWTTFYWNETMLQNGNLFLWILQGGITIGFMVIAVWLFFNIRYENRNKKWFRIIFNGIEWTPVMKAMHSLEVLNDFKEEKIIS